MYIWFSYSPLLVLSSTALVSFDPGDFAVIVVIVIALEVEVLGTEISLASCADVTKRRPEKRKQILQRRAMLSPLANEERNGLQQKQPCQHYSPLEWITDYLQSCLI